jgi:peroxiredoxin
MRLASLLLALAIPSAFAQPGLFGPVTAHIRAGDAVPDIGYTTILSSPDSASWSQSNLAGRFTVVSFFPNTTANLKPVFDWNNIVDKYKDRPIQFLWITAEPESILQPWLPDHPIKGWVLSDPQNKTARAFGLELPVTAYLGPDGKIIGFSTIPLPDSNTIDAVFDNRITTTPPTPDTMQSYRASKLVYLQAEPHRMPAPVTK